MALFKTCIVSLFSGFNLLLIMFLSDIGVDSYTAIVSGSMISLMLCSIVISEIENVYLYKAIENLQILNKKIARLKKPRVYKRKYKPGSLEKMSEKASNRKRDENGKFV